MWNEEELCGKDDLCPTWLRNWYQVSHRTAQNFDIVPLWLSHFHQIKCIAPPWADRKRDGVFMPFRVEHLRFKILSLLLQSSFFTLAEWYCHYTSSIRKVILDDPPIHRMCCCSWFWFSVFHVKLYIWRFRLTSSGAWECKCHVILMNYEFISKYIFSHHLLHIQAWLKLPPLRRLPLTGFELPWCPRSSIGRGPCSCKLRHRIARCWLNCL